MHKGQAQAEGNREQFLSQQELVGFGLVFRSRSVVGTGGQNDGGGQTVVDISATVFLARARRSFAGVVFSATVSDEDFTGRMRRGWGFYFRGSGGGRWHEIGGWHAAMDGLSGARGELGTGWEQPNWR